MDVIVSVHMFPWVDSHVPTLDLDLVLFTRNDCNYFVESRKPGVGREVLIVLLHSLTSSDPGNPTLKGVL